MWRIILLGKIKAIIDFWEMCLRVFSVAGIYCMLALQSALREITRGSILWSIVDWLIDWLIDWLNHL